MSFQTVLEDSLAGINMSLNKQLNKMLSGSNFLEPDTDVFVKNNMFYIVMDLPGVPKESVEMYFKDDQVVIKGEKVYREIESKPNFYSREIAYGKFEKKIKLPFVVNNQKSIKTSLKNGVLKIQINKDLEKNNFFSLKVSD
jgi:HSP20 family molecular chaperone IbpA